MLAAWALQYYPNRPRVRYVASKWLDVTHYHSFHESLFVINLPARANLSPQAQAVKELLM